MNQLEKDQLEKCPPPPRGNGSQGKSKNKNNGAGQQPPHRNSRFGGRSLNRVKRKPKTMADQAKQKEHRGSNSGISKFTRPKRKSIKGTNIAVDQAKEMTKKRRESMSTKVSEELRKSGSRESLPLSQMLASFSQRKLAVNDQLKEETYKIGFNVFEKSDEELVGHIDRMVNLFALTGILKEKQLLTNLVNAIKGKYKTNPFHNFKHAFGVAHMGVICMMRELEIAKAIGKRKILAFIVAALGHDLNHPGNDNAYVIATQNPLVEDYSMDAVLENYHAHELIKLLQQKDKNVFKFAPIQKQRDVKEFIVEAIIATDMKQHEQHVEVLTAIHSLKQAMQNKFMRHQVVNALMHACDLSGQCTDLEVAVSWEARIAEEFSAQADLLRARGKKVPKIHQDLDNKRHRAGLQLGFIDNVLEPLWAALTRIVPNMDGLYDNLTQVVRVYYELLHNHGEAKAQEFFEEYKSNKIFSTSGKQILKIPDHKVEGYQTDEEEEREVVRI